MAPLMLQELEITEQSPNEDLKTLLKSVKSDWQENLIQMKKMSGGYSCFTYHCYETSKPNEGVTVRVKKLFQIRQMPVVDAEFEIKTIKMISDTDIFPAVLAIFKNGYCYNYIEGEVLVNLSSFKDFTGHPITEDFTLRQIARKLAAIHSLKMEGEDYTTSNYLNKVHETLVKFYVEAPGAPDKKIIQEELEELIRYVDQLKSDMVFCHGDVHPGNMIWNKDTKELTCIDWEVAHIGHRHCDVANFLTSFTFIDAIQGPEKALSNELMKSLQEKFLQFYFEAWSQQCDKQPDETQFRNDVKLYELTFYLLLVIFIGTLVDVNYGIELPAAPISMMNYYFNMYMGNKISILQTLKLQ